MSAIIVSLLVVLHVQKSPFQESIVLKITGNKTGILKKDAINAINTPLQCDEFF